jgi:hypothetical protein
MSPDEIVSRKIDDQLQAGYMVNLDNDICFSYEENKK